MEGDSRVSGRQEGQPEVLLSCAVRWSGLPSPSRVRSTDAPFGSWGRRVTVSVVARRAAPSRCLPLRP